MQGYAKEERKKNTHCDPLFLQVQKKKKDPLKKVLETLIKATEREKRTLSLSTLFYL